MDENIRRTATDCALVAVDTELFFLGLARTAHTRSVAALQDRDWMEHDYWFAQAEWFWQRSQLEHREDNDA
jgi:hypothetical protein